MWDRGDSPFSSLLLGKRQGEFTGAAVKRAVAVRRQFGRERRRPHGSVFFRSRKAVKGALLARRRRRASPLDSLCGFGSLGFHEVDAAVGRRGANAARLERTGAEQNYPHVARVADGAARHQVAESYQRKLTHAGFDAGFRRGISRPVTVTGTRRMATVRPASLTMQSM